MTLLEDMKITTGSANSKVKKLDEKKKKVGEKSEEKGHRGIGSKHPTPTQGTDVLIGDEKQMRKKEEITRKETGSEPLPQLPWGHSVTSYDPQASYREPVL